MNLSQATAMEDDESPFLAPLIDTRPTRANTHNPLFTEPKGERYESLRNPPPKEKKDYGVVLQELEKEDRETAEQLTKRELILRGNKLTEAQLDLAARVRPKVNRAMLTGFYDKGEVRTDDMINLWDDNGVLRKREWFKGSSAWADCMEDFIMVKGKLRLALEVMLGVIIEELPSIAEIFETWIISDEDLMRIPPRFFKNLPDAVDEIGYLNYVIYFDVQEYHGQTNDPKQRFTNPKNGHSVKPALGLRESLAKMEKEGKKLKMGKLILWDRDIPRFFPLVTESIFIGIRRSNDPKQPHHSQSKLIDGDASGGTHVKYFIWAQIVLVQKSMEMVQSGTQEYLMNPFVLNRSDQGRVGKKEKDSKEFEDALAQYSDLLALPIQSANISAKKFLANMFNHKNVMMRKIMLEFPVNSNAYKSRPPYRFSRDAERVDGRGKGKGKGKQDDLEDEPKEKKGKGKKSVTENGAKVQSNKTGSTNYQDILKYREIIELNRHLNREIRREAKDWNDALSSVSGTTIYEEDDAYFPMMDEQEFLKAKLLRDPTFASEFKRQRDLLLQQQRQENLYSIGSVEARTPQDPQDQPESYTQPEEEEDLNQPQSMESLTLPEEEEVKDDESEEE